MDLDKLQVNACIRSGWQALDLGFLMARAWWRLLCIAGLVPMLPLAIVLLAIFFDSPFWALLVLWWLKPFWERLPLFIASRMLFDEAPGIWSSMKSLPLKDILPWLFWRRFSPQRAFDNPVTVLEGLKGAARRQRLRVLHGKYSDVALSNQFVCFLCELLLAFGLLVLFDFFTPDVLGIRFYDTFGDLTLAGEWLFSLAAIIAMSLVMPFHTMAGFALYLNRRIELEAWDIEISFRNLAERKRSLQTPARILPAVVLVFGLFGAGVPGSAEAVIEHDRESSAELIEQILQGKDFGQEREVRKWRFKDMDEEAEEEESFPEWIIDFFEWLEGSQGWWQGLSGIAVWVKILLVVLFAGLLLYLLRRYRGPLSRLIRERPKETAPEVLFGLDVTPESLPPDVPQQAIRLWGEGACREALSLLYRASLSRLIERYELAFRASHTEAECAALVRAHGIESLSEYFWQLTQTWRRLAYGHRLPSDDVLHSLCDGWARELSSGTE
ncbi:MAG: DUF4129 domain-containing protein [Gammaproteobacteria bacterium]|nr:DUF4129 domain-containing protein [Gammaproteobacteria bacterium]